MRISEFGEGGDHIGSRRSRRAFRLSVAAFAFFTIALWFSERSLRYEAAERLYMMSLTKEFASARPLLQNAVLMDEEKRGTPTPRYVAALAEREEDDKISATYEHAYRLEPRNASLAIRYGCRLFLEGRFDEAREKFKEAQGHEPRNALPAYLEAAALAQIENDQGDNMSDALALVARTNSSGRKVAFPEPLWFPDLPQGVERGYWYAGLRRRIVDECCAPLYQYADLVIKEAKYTKASWLETLQTFGERLADSATPGSLQAIGGMKIQLNALRQREKILEVDNRPRDVELHARRQKLESALAELVDFENQRQSRIDKEKAKFEFPFYLCWQSAALAMLVYFAFFLFCELVLHVAKSSWTLPHSFIAKLVLGCGMSMLFLLLVIDSGFQQAGGEQAILMKAIGAVWWAVFWGLLAFGLLYPATILPSVKAVVAKSGEHDDSDGFIATVRQHKRRAYISLMRRYFGIVCGLVIIVVCAWCLCYRIFLGLFPWQLKLLTSGLTGEELEVVRRVLGLL